MIRDMTFAQRSLLFAQLSSIAYLDKIPAKKEARKLGFTTVEFYDKEGAQAYRFMNSDDIVIACRGTQPTEFNDIKADLKAMPVLAETVGRVHHGFKTEVDELWPMIKEDLKRHANNKKDLWFTGHSLGAAMTTIIASRCHADTNMPSIKEVYTYGSPKVGWNKYVKSLNVPHHRWVNNNDIVTTVPPTFMGYRHHGEEHYLNHWGNVRMLTGWQRTKDKYRGFVKGIQNGRIDSFSDHFITEYIQHLEKFAQGLESYQL